MISNISFRGSETTGSVADRKIDSAKQETTGGIGSRINQDSIFTVDNEPKQDTVSFRGKEYGESQKTSTGTVFWGTLAAVAATVGLLGLAHKYNWTNSINNGKYKEYTDVITKPCFEACKFVKKYSYDQIVNLFNKSK